MSALRFIILFSFCSFNLMPSFAQDWDVVQVLPPANGFGTASIFDINNTGTIAGTACDAPSCVGSAPIIHQNSTSVFLDHPIQNTEAFGINNNNTVVGYTWDAGVQANVAEKWDSNGIRSHIGQYQNFTDTYAIDVNDSGVVIGRSFDRNTNQQAAWVWENGVFTQLPPHLGLPLCVPISINNQGLILGNCSTDVSTSNPNIGAIWDLTNQLSTYPLIGPPGREGFFRGYEINNNGEIVGEVVERLNSSMSYTGHASYWKNHLVEPYYLDLPSRDPSGSKFNGISAIATSINNFGNIIGELSTGETGGTNQRLVYWYLYNSQLYNLALVLRSKSSVSSFSTGYKINQCNQILLSKGEENIYLSPTGCVCGVNTQDANNNKIIDCMEPTAATKPPAPVIGVKGARVFVNVAVPPPGMGYKTVVQVYNSKNKRIGRKTTSGSQVEFKKLFGRTRKGQRLTVKANIYWTNGTITTQTSKRITKKFRVK